MKIPPRNGLTSADAPVGGDIARSARRARPSNHPHPALESED